MTVLNLHKIEKKILLTLIKNDNLDIEKLAASTSLSLDNVRRGIEWLKFKGLVTISIQKESIIQPLSEEPTVTPSEDKIQAIDRLTLPERRILNEIKKTGQKKIKINDK